MAKELEKRQQPGALAGPAAIPEHLQRQAGEAQQGMENVGQSDVTWPRLGLCQSTSPQRKESDPKYIPELKDGQFFNSITREVYGKQVRFIPLFGFKTNILFKAMEEGGGLLCQAQDGKTGVGLPGGSCQACPMHQWNGVEPPQCTEYFNWAVLVVGHGGHIGPDTLAILSFKSTSLKFAREFNGLLRLRKVHSWGNVVSLNSSELRNTANQSWFVPVPKAIEGDAGYVTKEQAPIAEGAYKAMLELQQAGRLKVDVEDDPSAMPSAGREPGDEGPEPEV